MFKITKKWCEENLGIEDLYCMGAKNLLIRWLPIGTKFKVNEYDSFESIITEKNLNLIS